MVVHWNHWCTSPGFEFCKQYTGFRLWRPHFKYRSSLKEVRRISKNCPILSYKHIFSKCFFIQSPFSIFNSGPWALTELYLPRPVPTPGHMLDTTSSTILTEINKNIEMKCGGSLIPLNGKLDYFLHLVSRL